MRVHYDTSADAFYVRFDERPYASSDEVEEGVILDYDKQGKLIGIEILNASQKLSPAFRASLSRKKVPVRIGARV